MKIFTLCAFFAPLLFLGMGCDRPEAVPAALPTLSLDKTTQSIGSAAGSFSVAVTSNFDWAVAGAPSWIAVSPSNGRGDGSVTLSYQANTTASERTASVLFDAGSVRRTLAVTQAAAASTLSIDKATQSIGSAAGSFAVSVACGSDWTISGLPAWITPNPPNGSGSKSVALSYQANPSIDERTATISFVSGGASKTLAVIQAAQSVSLTLSASAPGETIPANGKTYTVQVTATAPWAIQPTALTVSPTSATAGTTAVQIVVPPTADNSTRTVSVEFRTATGATERSAAWSGTQEKSPPPPYAPATGVGYVTTGSDATGLPAGLMYVGQFGGWNGARYTKGLYVDKRGSNTSGANDGTGDDKTAPWGYYTETTGVNNAYTGLENTLALTASAAVNYCRNKGTGWYLPALRQLKDGIYAAQTKINASADHSFKLSAYYWSSTEDNSHFAWFSSVYDHLSLDSYYNGLEGSGFKYTPYAIRCVREF